MAKHCDVCNNSYPDSEDHCPHCAAAARAAASEEAVDLSEPVIAEASEPSAEALPEPGPDSGDSVVSWSSLVEDAGTVPAGESPSSVDLGQPFVAEIASGSELPGATVSETPPAASESAVGGEPLVAEVASSGKLSGEPFVAEVASSDKLSSGPFVAEVTEEDASSAIDLGALASRPNETQRAAASEMPPPDDVAEEVEAGSSVNLGEAARPTDRPSSRDLIAEAVESGVDLGHEGGAAADVGEAEAEAAEADESAVDLGSARSPAAPSSAPEAVPERRVPPGSHHDLDLDAEEAAEHVDLGSAADEEAAAAALAEDEDRGPGSSGVDLGGAAGRPSKRPLGGSSSSAVDMGGPAPAKKSRKAAAAAEDDEDAAAALLSGGAAEKEADAEEPAPASARRKAADEDEEEAAAPAKAKADEEDEDEEPAAKPRRRAAAEDEEADEDETKTKKPPKARSGCGCLVLGGVLGLLVGAAVPIALAMFDVVDPAKEVGALVGISPKTHPAPGNANQGGPKPAPQGEAVAQMTDVAAKLKTTPDKAADAVEALVKERDDAAKKTTTLETDLAAAKTDADAAKKMARDAGDKAALTETQLKDVATKLKTTPDKAAGAVDTLVKEREDAAKKATALETDLTAAKKDADAAKKEAKDAGDKLALAETQVKAADAKLKVVNDRLVAAGIKGADAAKGIDALAADRAAADKTLDAVVAKVNTAHVKVDRKDVLKGVEQVAEAALANDPKGELMASRDELRRMGAALGQRHTPEQMLDIWMPVVGERRGKAEAAKATVDAERVRTDDRATAAAKKKAAAVLGLVKRDDGDYEAARTLLTEALAGAGPKAAWQAPAAQALKELTDPAAYYLPRARELYEDGKYKEAMLVLAEARKLFPKDAGNLQAVASLVQLDMALAKGKLDPASPAVIEAKRDAEAAAAAGSAEGYYALGRVNEELGNLAEAKTAYAKALAAHDDNDEAGARYRLALARVLKLQGAKPAGPRAALDMKRQPLLTLVLLVELGMQPGAAAGEDQATKLLKEVENAKDGPDTFMLKVQALALRGLWTPALKTYAAGLRPHLRRDYAEGLIELIDRTPALRRPSAMEPPNPLLADASYAAGLRHYFARRYADAEASFLKAVEYDNQDARYYYFLGLSRLALDKKADAEDNFREGAELESLNRPGREAVSTALERVQGGARQAVNRARP